ncbi:DUF2989 domain-containing protein [Candidatus Colwellia aromaticivorans]|uniref:DUF2989 domain-containing protein n=1 Tax=Candidatus Colwellia aromaticivorans TaxID=2267621 RepID=UPI000DF2EAC3|nr:DUF2989 domain-containing protein [Candidatus Colwellia aromaticivorans]
MKLLALLSSLLLLSSCDSNKSLTELCKENPQICQEFGQDSWCKRERIDVALARINLKTKENDSHKYNLLIAYEDYVDCMGLASQIQHIKLKEKTTMRQNNLINAKNKLAKLSVQTLDSTHPHLLYYHWSREQNNNSLAQFLKLEGSAALENSLSQFQLATHYAKQDNDKTLRLLFRSLELHQPNEKLIPEVFQTLATIFTNRDKPKQGYIWLKTYKLVTKKNEAQVNQQLKQYQRAYSLDGEFLDKVASNTLANIENSTFKAPKY